MGVPSAMSAYRSVKFRHPFDTAWGTLTLGLLLTAVLVALLRLISG